MRIWAAQGTVLFAALLLLATRARAADFGTLCDPDAGHATPAENPIHQTAEPQPPTFAPGSESKGPDEPRIIRDPLPPAVWSGGSMFALGGAYAGFRRLRKRLTSF
jgi:hypothetical protein